MLNTRPETLGNSIMVIQAKIGEDIHINLDLFDQLCSVNNIFQTYLPTEKCSLVCQPKIGFQPLVINSVRHFHL